MKYRLALTVDYDLITEAKLRKINLSNEFNNYLKTLLNRPIEELEPNDSLIEDRDKLQQEIIEDYNRFSLKKAKFDEVNRQVIEKQKETERKRLEELQKRKKLNFVPVTLPCGTGVRK